jgi:hypothetical protein
MSGSTSIVTRATSRKSTVGVGYCVKKKVHTLATFGKFLSGPTMCLIFGRWTSKMVIYHNRGRKVARR